MNLTPRGNDKSNVLPVLLMKCKSTAFCTIILMMLMIFPAERPPGYDRVRNAEIGNKDFELDVLEEAYTTEHWLVRIYKVYQHIAILSVCKDCLEPQIGLSRSDLLKRLLFGEI